MGQAWYVTFIRQIDWYRPIFVQWMSTNASCLLFALFNSQDTSKKLNLSLDFVIDIYNVGPCSWGIPIARECLNRLLRNIAVCDNYQDPGNVPILFKIASFVSFNTSTWFLTVFFSRFSASNSYKTKLVSCFLQLLSLTAILQLIMTFRINK